MTDNNKIYSANDIKVLKGLESVRKRPSMYIGDIGFRGLHHLLHEVIDNSIDECLAGYANKINVIIDSNNYITVEDNGRGIPVDYHTSEQKSALEVVMTVLHSGGKFNQKIYKISGGLHGVGISCVNALSSHLIVTVYRNDKIYIQEYRKGKPQDIVKVIGNSKYTGTTIKFIPDNTIFNSINWNYDIITKRLNELSYLNMGIRLNITDNRNKDIIKKEFYSKNGLYDFIYHLNEKKKHIIKEILYINTIKYDIPVEIALTYNDGYYENIISYVNNINTIEGGTHITGFKKGITRTLKNYIEKYNILKNNKLNFISEDYREGLTAIISIKLSDPQFEGQTKTKLGNDNISGIIETIIYDSFNTFLEENPKCAKNIVNKIVLSATARHVAKKAKDLVLKKNILVNSILPGKLSDCSYNNPKTCEIFLVEGDSAGGTAKQGRNKDFQAILPLKGKILNVEKSAEHKIYDNEEIKNIFNSLGVIIEPNSDTQEINIEKIRYNKIIIMTDADVDGSHIRTLILTFFFRYMKKIIEYGYLYIASPPLYLVNFGKVSKYCWNDLELSNTIKYYNSDTKKNIQIQRYKGLGEMNSHQLWDTTMNPENRILRQVIINDFNNSNNIFSTLMGDLVYPRKDFIERNAQYANVDI